MADPSEDLRPLAALRLMILNSRITQAFGPSDMSSEPPLVANGITYPHFHYGVDMVVPVDPTTGKHTIRAVASGVVTEARDDSGGFGIHYRIKAPNGFTYTYGHLDERVATLLGTTQPPHNLRVGEEVHAGDIIGVMGSTGNSTGPHLHLQITAPNGQPIDPGGRGANGSLNATNNIFYTLYHSLGFGGGFNSGQLAAPPDPVGNPLGLPEVPNPIPTNPGDQDNDTRFYPGLGLKTGAFPGTGESGWAGVTDPNTGTSTGWGQSGTTGSGVNITGLFGFLGQPGGIFGTPAQSTEQTASGGVQVGPVDIGAQTVAFLGVVLIGSVLLIAGVRGLGKEAPVQVVTAPVTDAAGAAVGAGKTVAKVAASG